MDSRLQKIESDVKEIKDEIGLEVRPEYIEKLNNIRKEKGISFENIGELRQKVQVILRKVCIIHIGIMRSVGNFYSLLKLQKFPSMLKNSLCTRNLEFLTVQRRERGSIVLFVGH